MKHNSGLSLLEMALVITIIGLLLGSLVVGRTMLTNARLHSVMTEIEDYRSTFKMFRDKYHGWPGDLYNAESLWGSDNSCPNTPANTTLKRETCNGNGDNHITNQEAFRAWQHLANAGFIKGIYSGAENINGTPNSSILGVNIPRSTFDGAGYFVYYHSAALLAPINASPALTTNPGWGAPEGNYIDITGIIPGTAQPAGKIFSSRDAFSIDQKIDDGFPGQGAVLSTPGETCTTILVSGALDPVKAIYAPGNSDTAACILSVKLGVE